MARTIVTGEHQTYWDIAESTLGDGHRWREILTANPNLGQVDLIPAGITINIPATDRAADNVHVVEKGDNLWTIAATELADAHDGDKPTNAEIVPYWRDVILTNEPHLRSGDPDLIYPDETVNLPTVIDDERTPPLTDAPEVAPRGIAVPVTPSGPTGPEQPTTTVPAAPVDTPTPANHAQANVDVEDDVDTDFQIPWLPGLAITGIASAGLLAAWHTQRRRRIRAHNRATPSR